jgi:hypothetical protein
LLFCFFFYRFCANTRIQFSFVSISFHNLPS